LNSGQGVLIAKRSISLSKTFLVVGAVLALLSVLIASLPSMVNNLALSGVPLNATGRGGLDLGTALPLMSAALQVFAAIIFATPVLLLYVYDKNNGVLEYFLSLGMNQRDVYRQYLKAALMLASGIVALEVAINLVVGLVGRANGPLLLETSGLVVALAIPAVAFGSLVMMSFSSLQKQRVGANQPLGMAIGIFMIMPAYIAPFAFPALALVIDLGLALIIAGLSLVTYLLSSRLISREKLLP